MVAEYNAHNLQAVFSRISAEGVARGRVALEPLALVIERQAKLNLSYAAHPLRTPTPAVPGKGPGLISGTLRRSITHSPIIPTGTGWTTKVGTAVGFSPPYGKTQACHYGYILEKVGDRAGNKYPFLEPAFRFGVDIAGPVIYREAYGSGWHRVM